MRNKTIDTFRGVIMIIMALDHASYFIINTHFYEGFDYISTYPSLLAFLVRWITHLCAPGFFLVLGYSLYNAYYKKKKHHLLLRGFFLVFLQLTVLNYVWKVEPIYIGVITILGLSIILLTIAMPLMKKYGLAIGLILIFLGQYIPVTDQFFIGLLFRPGLYGNIYVLYTLITWLGIASIGCYLGSLEKIPYKSLTVISLAIFIVFSLNKTNIKELLIIIKYPPTIRFISLTFTINFLLMHMIDKYHVHKKFLIAFGTEPLFFYVVHLYLYSLMGKIISASNYTTLFICYLISIPILYLLTKWYHNIKCKRLHL